MSNKFYLVIDQTSEDMYFRLGVFDTMRAACYQTLDQFEKNKEQLLYRHHYDHDEFEIVNIYEVEEGLSFDGDLGILVAEFRRERYYDDDDEFYLKLVKCPKAEVVMGLIEPVES